MGCPEPGLLATGGSIDVVGADRSRFQIQTGELWNRAVARWLSPGTSERRLIVRLTIFSVPLIALAFLAAAPPVRVAENLPGDVDFDCDVDMGDFNLLAAHLSGGPRLVRPCAGDVDGLPGVTPSDLDALVNFLEGVGAPLVDSCPPPGDVDQDGSVNLTDVFVILNFLFNGGPGFSPLCLGDIDGGFTVNINDAIALSNYLFAGGHEPVACGCP